MASGSGSVKESACDVGPALPGQILGQDAAGGTVGSGDGNAVAGKVEGGESMERVHGDGLVPWVEGSGERTGDGDKGGAFRDEGREKAQVQSVAWRPPKFLTCSSEDGSISSPPPTTMQNMDLTRPLPRTSATAQSLSPHVGSGGRDLHWHHFLDSQVSSLREGAQAQCFVGVGSCSGHCRGRLQLREKLPLRAQLREYLLRTTMRIHESDRSLSTGNPNYRVIFFGKFL